MTNIVLLSDGTGNSAAQVWRTNVWRLFEALDLSSNTQVAYYDDGVGTSSFKPLALLGGAFGWGLKRNVLDLYKFTCRNWKQNDEIFAFGFSRGAFTIRVLIGLINDQGLVVAQSEEELDRNARAAYRAYRRNRFHSVLRLERPFRALRDLFVQTHPKNTVTVPQIRFLGLWDTVAAYGLPVDEMTRGISQWLWPLELPDRRLGASVRRACHAVALDDERTTFHPVLWDERHEQPAPPDPDNRRWTRDERVSQVWFAGMHANVGGGYPDDSLSHHPLFWIMNEAQTCGLTFKPGALARVDLTKDKDGRMYDSRNGLGGYYRYGPRKMREFCDMKLSRRPMDQVQIATPKIHESAYDRVRNGAHDYAPIGWPDRYELVTCAGQIVPAPEQPAQAQGRAEAQEAVWNLVWWRRVVYFATVAATLYLVIAPLARMPPRTAESETALWMVSDGIRLAGNMLPGLAAPWINGYARDPGAFLVNAGLVAGLIMIGAMIGNRARSRMRMIWLTQPTSPTPGALLPDGVVYRLRNWPPYKATIWALKRHVAPFVFAILTVFFGLAAINKLAFNLLDGFGVYCRDTGTASPMAPRERHTFTFDTRQFCAPAGVKLETNGRYRIAVTPNGDWRDGSIPTGVAGFYAAEAPWRSIPSMVLATPTKRTVIRPWFRLIARVGSDGNSEEMLDPSPDGQVGEVIVARRPGELFFYVNDAVLAVPGLSDLFYRNNRGTAQITIERVR